jgi:lipopolysaccharide/colanic/teichoic acid biosynthesis glycosyltransferase
MIDLSATHIYSMIPGDPTGFNERRKQHPLTSSRTAWMAVRLRRALTLVMWRLRPLLYDAAKGALDRIVALISILLFCPLLLVVAACIKLTDRGPVLYRQERIGRRGKVFTFPKFRSMVPNAHLLINQLASLNHHGDSITFKMRGDPRVTWIGRIIRRTSIDELPQLWCVLAGDMSLVGPRPALPREVAYYDQWARRRLETKPGLTCLWQVGGRADLPFTKQLLLDIEYIERRSLWLDLKILAWTVPAVVLGRGAY